MYLKPYWWFVIIAMKPYWWLVIIAYCVLEALLMICNNSYEALLRIFNNSLCVLEALLMIDWYFNNNAFLFSSRLANSSCGFLLCFLVHLLITYDLCVLWLSVSWACLPAHDITILLYSFYFYLKVYIWLCRMFVYLCHSWSPLVGCFFAG